MTFDPKLAHAIREAAARNPDGTPLPAGHRRTLSPSEVAKLRESLRSGAGLGEAARTWPASVVTSSRAPIPGSVAEQHPEWLESGFIDSIVAEVATRTAAVAKLETDRSKLAQMSNEAFAEHVEAVSEAAEMAGAPLPPARLAPKQLSEMSDQEFRAYSERLLSGPQRLTPPPNRRVNEAMDVAKLTEVAGSTPSTAEESFETTRSVYEGVGRRLKSPFWR